MTTGVVIHENVTYWAAQRILGSLMLIMLFVLLLSVGCEKNNDTVKSSGDGVTISHKQVIINSSNQNVVDGLERDSLATLLYQTFDDIDYAEQEGIYFSMTHKLNSGYLNYGIVKLNGTNAYRDSSGFNHFVRGNLFDGSAIPSDLNDLADPITITSSNSPDIADINQTLNPKYPKIVNLTKGQTVSRNSDLTIVLSSTIGENGGIMLWSPASFSADRTIIEVNQESDQVVIPKEELAKFDSTGQHRLLISVFQATLHAINSAAINSGKQYQLPLFELTEHRLEVVLSN